MTWIKKILLTKIPPNQLMLMVSLNDLDWL